MLSELHVKNMALIEEVELSFGKGLNVITGETGAGKSLLLGSVDLALGGKFSQEMMRGGADSALTELIFSVEDEKTRAALTELGYPPEEDQVIIVRKIQNGRSLCRVNGETCTTAQLKKIAELLIHIHGQRENQTLLKPEKQLEMLDTFGKKEIDPLREKTAGCYRSWREAGRRLAQYDLDEAARAREVSMLEYEIREIEEAAVLPGEEEELEQKYRLMKNARSIVEALGQVHRYTGYEEGAGDLIGRAIQEMTPIAGFDEALQNIAASLGDVDAILDDINRQAASYLDDFTFSEQEFQDIENRLDRIRSLQAKYGSTAEAIEAYAQKARERLDFLSGYEEDKIRAQQEQRKAEEALEAACSGLSRIRRKWAKVFAAAIEEQLSELNFAQGIIEIAFDRSASYQSDGYDEIALCISTNPGEPVRPLAKVASGGELARIMLAIRNILADEENTGTLIFDEIDAGISGRTAQKVSEKMASIAAGHQILCVTHLAQIAAMADQHFLIEKGVAGGETRTTVRLLDREEEIGELARILGGAELTETVYQNAAEMKQLAEEWKL